MDFGSEVDVTAMTPSQGSMTLNQTRLVNLLGPNSGNHSLGGTHKGLKIDPNNSGVS